MARNDKPNSRTDRALAKGLGKKSKPSAKKGDKKGSTKSTKADKDPLAAALGKPSKDAEKLADELVGEPFDLDAGEPDIADSWPTDDGDAETPADSEIADSWPSDDGDEAPVDDSDAPKVETAADVPDEPEGDAPGDAPPSDATVDEPPSDDAPTDDDRRREDMIDTPADDETPADSVAPDGDDDGAPSIFDDGVASDPADDADLGPQGIFADAAEDSDAEEADEATETKVEDEVEDAPDVADATEPLEGELEEAEAIEPLLAESESDEADEPDEAIWPQDAPDVADAPVEQKTPAVGAPLEDERFIERARRREEKARKAQAKEEAKRMRQEAKQMLTDAKKRERTQAVLDAHMEKVSTIGEDLGYDPNRPITRVPELPEHMEEVSFRVIEEERAFIRLAFDTVQNNYQYEIIEPHLTPNEQKIMTFLRDTLIRTLDGRRGNDVDWAQYLRESVQQAIVDHDILIDHISTERILYYLIRDFLGYGPIDVLMRDDQLEDISCDGPGIPIYIFHRQHESIRSTVMFDDDLEIDSFVIRLAQRSGKHISIADPLLDATLPDGSRLQATLSREVTSRGSSFTIRKFREEPFTPPDLINYGTVTTPMCAYFWFLMEEGRSLIYAGGTASGKTTSLNAWCQFIPPEKKIVSIEDTREMNLLHENWIAGVTRSGFGGETVSGKRAGSIGMYQLLEAALRQRPEYLLVGEVRGAEALTLFQAMATGHAVYSTMHADSAKSAVYRLENPPINVPRMMLQTLDTIVIQGLVKVGERMGRRVKEVVEIIGFDPDTDDLLTNTVFYWDATTDRHVFTGHSGVFDQIQEKKGWNEDEFQVEWERRMLVLEWMRHKEITHFKEFSGIIHQYYQRPDSVMKRIQDDGFVLDASIVNGVRAGDTTAMYGGAASLDERVAPWRDDNAPVDALAEAAARRALGDGDGTQ